MEPRQIANAGVSGWIYEDPPEIDDHILSFFLRYWCAKRKNDRLPRHGDFEPRDVGSLLPWVILVDGLPELADFRYRVIGSRICDYFLGDSTGRTVTEAFANYAQLSQETLWLYRRTCTRKYPLRLRGPAVHLSGIFFPAYDALYLPYSRDGIHADRVLNIFSLKDSTWD